MADPVTDSREPGFNPEVEESKAAEAAAAKKRAAEARGEPAEPETPPLHTHRCSMCGALLLSNVKPCPHCGAGYEPEALPGAEKK